MTHYYFMVNVAHFITLRKLLQATMNSFFWKKAVYSFIYFVSFSVAWHHDTSFVQSKSIGGIQNRGSSVWFLSVYCFFSFLPKKSYVVCSLTVNNGLESFLKKFLYFHTGVISRFFFLKKHSTVKDFQEITHRQKFQSNFKECSSSMYGTNRLDCVFFTSFRIHFS